MGEGDHELSEFVHVSSSEKALEQIILPSIEDVSAFSTKGQSLVLAERGMESYPKKDRRYFVAYEGQKYSGLCRWPVNVQSDSGFDLFARIYSCLCHASGEKRYLSKLDFFNMIKSDGSYKEKFTLGNANIELLANTVPNIRDELRDFWKDDKNKGGIPVCMILGALLSGLLATPLAHFGLNNLAALFFLTFTTATTVTAIYSPRVVASVRERRTKRNSLYGNPIEEIFNTISEDTAFLHRLKQNYPNIRNEDLEALPNRRGRLYENIKLLFELYEKEQSRPGVVLSYSSDDKESVYTFFEEIESRMQDKNLDKLLSGTPEDRQLLSASR